MKSKSFYENMQVFGDFSEITRDEHFQRIPSDWKVIITDVRGSTRAIESGRYKDVNVVGAATIVCAQNVMKDEEFPFVFGGDGATLVVSREASQAVIDALLALRQLSEAQFGLTLRVGAVDVAEIEKDAKIEVAKLSLAGKKSIAIFRGGGLAIAERKVKNEPEKYELRDTVQSQADLAGLSCRWQPIPTQRGTILSLLVSAQDDGTYREILHKLNEIFDGRLDDANPVNSRSMTYKSLSQCIREERRHFPSTWSLGFLSRILQIVVSVIIFKFKLNPSVLPTRRYVQTMRSHSDYRKFDDMLRMIVDCTAAQVTAIRDYLESLRVNGRATYGLHESQTSLMTCFFQGTADGEHVHFIDGGDGGYAMAAKQMKAQWKER